MGGLVMDILLIYPSLTIEERYGRRGLSDVGGDLPPLGIAQLASSLECRGFYAGLIDAVVLNMDENDVLEEIGRIKPRAVGISAVTPIFNRAAIRGIGFRRKGGSVHLTRPREPIEDLDSLPFPARHLLKGLRVAARFAL